MRIRFLSANTMFVKVLSSLLNDEFGAVNMYVTFASQVTGPRRVEMREHFNTEAAEELGHAKFLSDKLASMGRYPIINPTEFPKCKDIQDMLYHIINAESIAIKKYNIAIKVAEKIGDNGTKVKLEDILSDETKHKEETSLMINRNDDLKLFAQHKNVSARMLERLGVKNE